MAHPEAPEQKQLSLQNQVPLTLTQADLGGNPLRQYLRFRRDPIGFLMDTQPLADLVRIPSVTGKPSYILHHPELIKAVLALEEHKVVKGNSAQILGITLGRGLLTSEDPEHSVQRRLMQPAFHKNMLESASGEIVRLTHQRIHSWPVGAFFPISDAFLDLTLDVVFHTLFGASVGEDRSRLHRAVEDSVRFSAQRLMSALPVPLWLPTPMNRRHRRAVDSLDEVIEKLIQQGQERVGMAVGSGSSSRPTSEASGSESISSVSAAHSFTASNVLDYLFAVRTESGEGLSRQEIRDQLATFIIGGHETTANLLGWVVFELARHPQAWEEAAREVDRVLAGRHPTFEDVRKLGFIRQVLRETMRLYPPAWTVLRETVEDLRVANVEIEAGAALIISPYVLHRSPHDFPQPETFDPQRFSDEVEHTWRQFSYIPFGAGSRTCIGNTFAQMEAAFILAMLIQRYRWTLPSGTPVHPEPSVSLRIRDGLRVVLTPRS
ncbi:cytochrome P450 [Alicyclobacillus tolerans]|uniref:cytochrome P450 n=1 Tax=Alicyclobacillus tolerans TaxID=90970 RepID=UPI001F3C61AE|nr:cytochrome P450 [Alicyclobacillus tolerans]MCF8565661.1 cytochrome P450 [Alicyclobacillus tolerans]